MACSPMREVTTVPAKALLRSSRRTERYGGERANLLSGPGTDYDKVGLLEVGDEVTVTGEAGEWLRIEAPNGGEALLNAFSTSKASSCFGIGRRSSSMR